MEKVQLYLLNEDELLKATGGFVCGGLCVIAIVGTAASLFSAGVAIGDRL